MAERGLLWTGAKITPAMFEGARQLRGRVRNYLQCDPIERHRNKDAIRSLNDALKLFPLAVEARNHGGMALRPARGDALAGLSAISAELYNGSVTGTLDRLKTCAAEECRRVFFYPSNPPTPPRSMSTLSATRIHTRAS